MKLNRYAIEKCLGDLGWKHRELADRVGVPPETLSRWLSSQMPTVQHLMDLTTTLNKGLKERHFPGKLTMEDLLDT